MFKIIDIAFIYESIFSSNCFAGNLPCITFYDARFNA